MENKSGHGKTRDRLKKVKKRVVAGTVATVSAASILLSSVVNNPADIVQGENAFSEPAPIVQMMDYEEPPDDDTDDGEDELFEEKKRGGLKSRIRAFLLRCSPVVRVCICLPLWGLGWVLTAMASALWQMLSPVWGTLLGFALTVAALLLVLVGTVKAISPDTPVRKILNRKSILSAVIIAAAAKLCLVMLQLFAPDGERIGRLLKSLAAAASVLCVSVPAAVRHMRDGKNA